MHSTWSYNFINTPPRPRQFEFNPFSGEVLVGTLFGDLALVSLEHNRPYTNLGNFGKFKKDSILGICWFRKNQYKFIAGSAYGQVICSDTRIDEHRENVEFPRFEKLTSVHINSTDAFLMTSGYSVNVNIYDVATAQKLFTHQNPHSDHINICRFSNCSPHLYATSSFDTTAKLWDLRMPPSAPIYTLTHSRGLIMLTFSPDDNYLLTSAVDNEITQHFVLDGRVHFKCDAPKSNNGGNFTRAYYSSSGSYIFSGASEEDELHIFDAGNGSLLTSSKLYPGRKHSSLYIQSLRGHPHSDHRLCVLSNYRDLSDRDLVAVSIDTLLHTGLVLGETLKDVHHNDDQSDGIDGDRKEALPAEPVMKSIADSKLQADGEDDAAAIATGTASLSPVFPSSSLSSDLWRLLSSGSHADTTLLLHTGEEEGLVRIPAHRLVLGARSSLLETAVRMEATSAAAEHNEAALFNTVVDVTSRLQCLCLEDTSGPEAMVAIPLCLRYIYTADLSIPTVLEALSMYTRGDSLLKISQLIGDRISDAHTSQQIGFEGNTKGESIKSKYSSIKNSSSPSSPSALAAKLVSAVRCLCGVGATATALGMGYMMDHIDSLLAALVVPYTVVKVINYCVDLQRNTLLDHCYHKLSECLDEFSCIYNIAYLPSTVRQRLEVLCGSRLRVLCDAFTDTMAYTPETPPNDDDSESNDEQKFWDDYMQDGKWLPPRCFSHTCTEIGDGKLLFVGGQNKYGFVNMSSLFILDVKGNPVQHSKLAETIPASTTMLPSLSSSPLELCSKNQDSYSLVWSAKSISSTDSFLLPQPKPLGMVFHSAIALQRKCARHVLTLGGHLHSPGSGRKDLYLLDTLDMSWSAPVAQGTPPSARVQSTACAVYRSRRRKRPWNGTNDREALAFASLDTTAGLDMNGNGKVDMSSNLEVERDSEFHLTSAPATRPMEVSCDGGSGSDGDGCGGRRLSENNTYPDYGYLSEDDLVQIVVFGGYSNTAMAATDEIHILECKGIEKSLLTSSSAIEERMFQDFCFTWKSLQIGSGYWQDGMPRRPVPRACHASAIINAKAVYEHDVDPDALLTNIPYIKMIIFGGIVGGTSANDLWCLNIPTDLESGHRAFWEELANRNNGPWPEPRRGHTLTVIREDERSCTLLMLGGMVNGEDMSDCGWALEIEYGQESHSSRTTGTTQSSVKWTRVLLQDDSELFDANDWNSNYHVCARASHTCCKVGERVFVFGGKVDATYIPSQDLTHITDADQYVRVISCSGSPGTWHVLSPSPPMLFREPLPEVSIEFAPPVERLSRDLLDALQFYNNRNIIDLEVSSGVHAGTDLRLELQLNTIGEVDDHIELAEAPHSPLPASSLRLNVHKSLLAARCEYFRALLEESVSEMTDIKSGRFTLQLDLATPAEELSTKRAFLSIITFIYSNVLHITDPSDVGPLIRLSDMLHLSEVIRICEGILTRNVSQDSVWDLLQVAEEDSSLLPGGLPDLKHVCFSEILRRQLIHRTDTTVDTKSRSWQEIHELVNCHRQAYCMDYHVDKSPSETPGLSWIRSWLTRGKSLKF